MSQQEIYLELGIGTRIRRLYEMMSADADRIYEEAGLNFRVSYFYVIYALSLKDAMPIAEIAKLAGFSHSAVSQTVKKLSTEGLLKIEASSDGRQKLITLSETGKSLQNDLKPYWEALEASMKDAINEAGINILDAINQTEKAYKRISLYDRAKAKLSAGKSDLDFTIEPYSNRHKQAFYDFNVHWLKKYFVVEPIDEKVLSDPEKHILSKGGEIFFAVENGKAFGCVAMKPAGDGNFELTKLAVDPKVRKGGAGTALCQKVIERFNARDGNTLFLETNTKLETAIRLYWRIGFKELPSPFKSPYERANYYMEWHPEMMEA